MGHLLLEDRLGTSWAEMLQEEIKKDYFKRVAGILKNERIKYQIYPKSQDVFKAYRLTPYDTVKVVVVGEDPYYNEGQANGLAFSVNNTLEEFPPSLKNIFKEIERDLDIMNLNWNGDLSSWAEQGVFLLNTCLTVRQGNPASHSDIGWQNFTKKSIELLNISPVPIVFMLWGSHGKSYKPYIDGSHHCILETSHPSQLSSYRGFNGCGHFSKCNEFLEKHNLKPINWITTL
jgi:uracil-DNA glycosylase